MFSVREVVTSRGTLQYRDGASHRAQVQDQSGPVETADRSVIVHSFKQRWLPVLPRCCYDRTPTFPDGNRIIRGESVTFPNLFPFGEGHVVTVMTREHAVMTFSRQQVVDALLAQIEALRRTDGYASINWNFLPSAGASLVHPHMQGLSDSRPSRIAELYLAASEQYRKKQGRNYWDAVREQERVSDRYLFGDEILWSAHAVPVGEREVRGILPISSLDEMENYVDLAGTGHT